jgi:hypothetical protein
MGLELERGSLAVVEVKAPETKRHLFSVSERRMVSAILIFQSVVDKG